MTDYRGSHYDLAELDKYFDKRTGNTLQQNAIFTFIDNLIFEINNV